MSRISEVFLDLDDTLNMFTPSALKYLGCPIDVDRYIGVPEFRGNYDIVARTNYYRRPGTHFTLQEFWNAIPRDFWATTPVAPEAYALIEACERLVGKDNVIILTAPTKDPDCLAGKLEWIHNNLPRHYHRQYIITPRKQYNAAPGRLMVDDADSNVDAWAARGGSYILVPQPHNRNWELAENGYRWEYIVERLDGFSGGRLTNLAAVA